MATGELMDPAMEAAANLPRDLAVLKMENDQIFAMAAARPRNFPAIKAELAEMIENFPQFADEAIYEKPVGKGDDGKQKYARGLSVRAAECLAECYGFNRIHTDVEMLPDERVKVYASFTDFQRGRTWEDSTIVSPFYRTRAGQMARWPEDRFFNVTIKAEKSKLVREVINRSINQPLKAWFEAQCEAKLGQTLDDAAIEQIVKGFAFYGANETQVESIVGRPRAMGWTQSDRVRLLGVFNAIKSGETTVAELFGDSAKEEKPKTTTGTVDGLSNPKGKMDEARKTKPEAAVEKPADVVQPETKPKAEPKRTQKPLEPVTTTQPPTTTMPQTKTASAKPDYAEQFEAAPTIDALHEMNIELATDDRVTDEERALLLDVFKRRKESLSKK
jgi:hypothetical protein